MFRALLCSSSGSQKLYYTASGIVTPAGGRPVRRLRQDSLSIILVINQIILVIDQLNAQILVL